MEAASFDSEPCKSPASPTGLHVVRTGSIPTREGKPYTSPEPKLLYQSMTNSERMITSVGQNELPDFVEFGLTEAAPHVGGIYSSRFSAFFSFFLLLMLLPLVSSTYLQTTIRNEM